MAALTRATSCPPLLAASLWKEGGAHETPLSALTATVLLAPLTEQGDALTVARGRVRALHARLAREPAAGEEPADGAARSDAAEVVVDDD